MVREQVESVQQDRSDACGTSSAHVDRRDIANKTRQRGDAHFDGAGPHGLWNLFIFIELRGVVDLNDDFTDENLSEENIKRLIIILDKDYGQFEKFNRLKGFPALFLTRPQAKTFALYQQQLSELEPETIPPTK